jgi:hypothetical protein
MVALEAFGLRSAFSRDTVEMRRPMCMEETGVRQKKIEDAELRNLAGPFLDDRKFLFGIHDGRRRESLSQPIHQSTKARSQSVSP